MALARKHQKIFGKNAQATDLGVVGSKVAGNPQYSTDIETLQSLVNWEEGLRALVTNSYAPYLQDHNSLFYVITSQLAYLFQAGIAEWNSQTEYVAERSIVFFNKKLFIATANNTNIEPENTEGWSSYWKCLSDWGMITGKIYNQPDLWGILLKGLSNNTPLADEIGGYPKNTILRFYDGNASYLVSSLVDNNMEEPTKQNIQYRESDTDKKWKCIERIVIKSFKDSNYWYRLYSDGWIEQGGTVDTGSAARSRTATITFPKEFEDNIYAFSFIPIRGGDYANIVGAIGTKSKTATSIFVNFYGRSEDDATRYFCWEAKGYAKDSTVTTIIDISGIQNPSSSSTIVEQIGSDITVSANDTFNIELAGGGFNGTDSDDNYGGNGGIVRCVHTFENATTLRLKKIRGYSSPKQIGLVLFSVENNTETPILAAGGCGLDIHITGHTGDLSAPRYQPRGGSGYIGGATSGSSYGKSGYSYNGVTGNSTSEGDGSGCGQSVTRSGRKSYGGTGYVASFLADDTVAIDGSASQGNTTYAYAKIQKIEE